MKKIISLLMSLLLCIGLVACNNTSTELSNDSFEIDELGWAASEKEIDGNKRVVIELMNNGNHAIRSIYIYFDFKSDVTEKQKEEYFKTSDAIGLMEQEESDGTSVYCDKILLPQEIANDIVVRIDNPSFPLKSMEQFDLLEIKSMKVSYKKDDKLITTSYDYKTKTYKDEDTEEVYTWPTSQIATDLPKLDLDFVTCTIDNDNEVSISGRGCDLTYFETYVKECQEKGFNKNSSEPSNYSTYYNFEDQNSEGITLAINYESSSELMFVKLEK